MNVNFFQNFFENRKKQEIPEWFYIGARLYKDLFSGPSKSAPAGTIVTLNNLEGITTNPAIVKKDFYNGVILKMPGKETLELNKLSKVDYENPNYLVNRGFRAIKRLASGPSVNRKTEKTYATAIRSLFYYLKNDYPEFFQEAEDESSYSRMMKNEFSKDQIDAEKFTSLLKQYTPTKINKKFVKLDNLKNLKNVNDWYNRILAIIKKYNPSFYSRLELDKFSTFKKAVHYSVSSFSFKTDEEEWVTKRQPKKINIGDRENILQVNQLHVPAGSIIYIDVPYLLSRWDNDLDQLFSVNPDDYENSEKRIEEIKTGLKNKLKNFSVVFIRKNSSNEKSHDDVHSIGHKNFSKEDFEEFNQVAELLKKYKEIPLSVFYRLCKNKEIPSELISKSLKFLQFQNLISVKNEKIYILDKMKEFNKESLAEKQIIDFLKVRLFNGDVKLASISIDQIVDNLSESESDKKNIINTVNQLIKDKKIYSINKFIYLKAPDVDEDQENIIIKFISNYNIHNMESVFTLHRATRKSPESIQKILCNLIIDDKVVRIGDNFIIKQTNLPNNVKYIIDVIKNKNGITISNLHVKVAKAYPEYKDSMTFRKDLYQAMSSGKIFSTKSGTILFYRDKYESEDEKSQLSILEKQVLGLFASRFVTGYGDVCDINSRIENCSNIAADLRLKKLLTIEKETGRIIPVEKLGELKVQDCFEYKKITEFFNRNPDKQLSEYDIMKKFSMSKNSLDKFLSYVEANSKDFYFNRSKSKGIILTKKEIVNDFDEKIKQEILKLLKQSPQTAEELSDILKNKFKKADYSSLIKELLYEDNLISFSKYDFGKLINNEVDEQEIFEKLKNDIDKVFKKQGYLLVKDLNTYIKKGYEFYAKFIFSAFISEEDLIYLQSIPPVYEKSLYVWADSPIYKKIEAKCLQDINNRAAKLKTEILPNENLVKNISFYEVDLGISLPSSPLFLPERFNDLITNSLISHNLLFKYKHGLFPEIGYISLKKDNYNFWKDDPLVIDDIKQTIGDSKLNIETIYDNLIHYGGKLRGYSYSYISSIEAFVIRMVQKGILKREIAGEIKKYYYSLA